ncbi:MAG: nucleotide sugar dehydrogenase [Hyphomicrobiaceae bacterium]
MQFTNEVGGPGLAGGSRAAHDVAELPLLKNVRIAVIGLGYVGLPLAVYLGRHFPVIGFDLNEKRIGELRSGIDRTHEVMDEEFEAAKTVTYSTSPSDLSAANFYIITVPTPIDGANNPDLLALRKASETIGKCIKRGDVVVYESTVYPGATEEECIPIIERVSGLVYNRDFFAGYSPERINPGDVQRRLPDIPKVTSGSTPEAAELVNAVYGTIIRAGTHRAASIRVAEAAKVIENIQRDVNIALVNELCQLFKKMGLDTRDVLAAAGTKWNFHGYRPGLVGGHCIGVDPYYLTHKAHKVGFHAEMILAGRKINDGMAAYVAHDVITTMLRQKIAVGQARLLVLGFSFKENVPDVRNTKVADLVKEIAAFVSHVTIYDPLADPEEVHEEYGLVVTNTLPQAEFDGAVLAVAHDEIVQLGAAGIRKLLRKSGPTFVYDVKGILPAELSDGRL